MSGASTPSGAVAASGGLAQWWTEPLPMARIAVFRLLAYLFIPIDVFVTTPWVARHAEVPTGLYQPLVIARILHLPVPTTMVVEVVKWALVAGALMAASGRAPRLLGTAVFLLYAEWMVIGMSYGKVDHDRFAFLVALAVLPTLGRARLGDQTRSEAAGWALRCVQVAVMLTYFFASWAKIRYGGWNWATGATLTRAVLRRGNQYSDWTLNVPGLLVGAQWVMIIFEASSPLMLLVRRDRARVALVLFLIGFHVMTFVGIGIIFLPHVVAILSMLPWERLTAWRPGPLPGPHRRRPALYRPGEDMSAPA